MRRTPAITGAKDASELPQWPGTARNEELEGPTGIEPAFSAWEADVLPLDDGPGWGKPGEKPDGYERSRIRSAASPPRRHSGSELSLWLADGELREAAALILRRPRELGARQRRELERERLRERCAR